MNKLNKKYIVYAGSFLFFLIVIANGVNFFIYHYPGNNYFPPTTAYVAVNLVLLYTGLSLQYGRASRISIIAKEIAFFYTVMLLLVLATNAVQYTPFAPIDKKILIFEQKWHVNTQTLMTWARSFPGLTDILSFVYDSLPTQMTYFPLILIVLGRFQTIRNYYFLLIISTLIGFSFYYFFPTTAPASIITNLPFSEAQQATGLKFMQIHHYIKPTTLEGGMIAFPSFHVIWAWLCLYLLKEFQIGWIIMLPINFLLMMSCVMLGWHYCMDIVAAGVVILLSHGLLFIATKKTTKINKLSMNHIAPHEPYYSS